MAAQEHKKSGFYFYLALAFSLAVLVYSAYLILNTVSSYSENPTESFYYNLVLGLIGVILSVSSLTNMRRRMQVIKTQNVKTFTVEFCEKCSFKKLREFKIGDYVQNKVGPCPQCNGDLVISSIYSEYPKE